MEPSGTFADFLSQMPTEIWRMFFIFFILLIMTIVAYILLRQRRARTGAGGNNPNATSGGGSGLGASAYPSPSPLASGSASSGDMPDIDMLLAMTEPTSSQPAPTPLATEPPPPRQPGIVSVQLSTGVNVEAAEMLILSRDRGTNKLIVQIGEYAYTGAEDNIDPEFRRRFIALMKELSGVAPRLSRGTKAPKAATPPKSDLEEEPAPAAPTPATLAGQIEQHLQAKLQATGAFSGRSIHVSDAPDGGVSIEVDGQHFDSVGAISDPEVKSFIGQVVAEWQESQKPER